jgi:PIN domain nuclease of toxin-antitoxin system
VRLLLDTPALLWWLAGDERLSTTARAAIADLAHEVHVSTAAAWEVTTKHRLGRLPGAGPLAVDFAREVAQQGFRSLPIAPAHGHDAGALPGPHRDPLDRMLIAQARHEHMALVSHESVFDGCGIARLWCGR